MNFAGKTFNFREWRVAIEEQRYAQNNSLALEMVDSDTGEPITRLTVNVPGLASDEIAIKDWSENEGVLDWAIKNKIVHPPHRHTVSGYVTVPVCRLQ